MSTQSQKIEFWIPLVILALGTAVSFWTDLDLKISGLFYDKQTTQWFLKESFLFDFGNKYGPGVSAVFFLWAFAQWLRSFVNPKQLVQRTGAIFILLCYLIGPLFLVHVVMKETWKRPRPREVIQFDGKQQFTKVLVIQKGKFAGKSFPSGHAAGGFVALSMYFLYKRKSKKLALSFLGIGFTLGIWLSITRIVSGGHFFSDTLWAFGLNWFLSYFLYYYWFLKSEQKARTPFQASRKRYLITGGTTFLVIAIVSAPFLFGKKIRKNYPIQTITIAKTVTKIKLIAQIQDGNIHTYRKNIPQQVQIFTRLVGAGIQVKTKRILITKLEGTTLIIHYQTKQKGIHTRYQSHNDFIVPYGIPVEWDVHTKSGRIFYHQK